MNHRNYRQFYEYRAPVRTQLNVLEQLHWPREAFIPPISHSLYRQSFIVPPNTAELGICDGMSNCHMTESWTSVLGRPINPPVPRISNDMPIVNPYVSLQTPFEVHPSMHPGAIDNSYSQRSRKAGSAWLDFEFAKPSPRKQAAPSRAEPMEEKVLRQKRLTQCLKCFDDSEVVISEEKIQTSVKFQDRNKRVDFKIKFREENRKLDGCFHNDESKSPADTMSNVAVPPPKKKWIRHYMTGKILTDFVRIARGCEPGS